MINTEYPQEPAEYVRLHHLLAVNDEMLTVLSEQYESGTDAPPTKTIESRFLSRDCSFVQPSSIADYRAYLVQFKTYLEGQISLYRRTKVEPYELGNPTKPAPKKGPRRAAAKKPKS